MNSCLSHNNIVSLNKFLEILKFIFIGMKGIKNLNNSNNITHKTMIYNIYREFINSGF